MEAKFKVGDRIRHTKDWYWSSDYQNALVNGIEYDRYRITNDKGDFEGGVMYFVNQEDWELVTPTITIGSTWYWQGEKDSPVTVVGFDSKGQIVFEFGFDDDLSGRRKGEVISYLSDEKEFTTRYKNVPNKPKAQKLTGYVRVLKPAEGYLVNDKSDEYIFQSVVFSDEARTRTAVPYGFEVVDVVKVEWESKE